MAKFNRGLGRCVNMNTSVNNLAAPLPLRETVAVSTQHLAAALDFEPFPRLLRAARGSEGTALCDARRADVPLHLLWPVFGMPSLSRPDPLTPVGCLACSCSMGSENKFSHAQRCFGVEIEKNLPSVNNVFLI